VSAAPSGEWSLFMSRVTDLVTRASVTCPPGASAVEVARLLGRERVGSVIVVDADVRPIGIVTDRDLRAKIVGEARDPAAARAADIMSAPLLSIAPGAFAFEALLEMTRRDVHHLPIVDGGRLVGVLSSNDFLLLHTRHPALLAREMAAADSIEALRRLAARTTPVVRRLLDEGGSAYDIGRIVAELNDRLVVRVLELSRAGLERSADPAPDVPWCWLAFGSEARREQTLRTDQDNGLVYADPPEHLRERAREYYGRLTAATIEGLVAVGFPRCPGNVMASNPRWCQPLSVWKANFHRWLDHPSPQEVLDASIFFDLRPLVGALDLGEGLGAVIRAEAPTSRVFLGLLARDVVARRVPLTLFGNIATESGGDREGTVDVKAAGSMQIVGAARVAALELGVAPRNTIDRIRAAGVAGLYTPEETREITDAYQHFMRLRLVHQLARIAAGAPPDNHVDPATLSHADALLFRDALKTVERMQEALRARFLTDRLG
jgi:CBS domain-containing protein